jgi:glycosyltransferase involved in cell wall biosynthesis
MRIAITLQSLDATWGGIGVYTEEIVKHLLQIDSNDEYVLLYPGFGAARKLFGQYRRYKNATEVETEGSSIPIGWYWDQIIVPRIVRQYAIDVLFNPFLSVPICARCKKVMIMHNVEYHTVPHVYTWKKYAHWFFLEKMLLPAADRVISLSNVMTQDFCRVVPYPPEHVRTIYHGVSEKFRVIRDDTVLHEAREAYVLPEQFLLFVGHLYPQKNFANLVRALHLIAQQVPHDLVVAGRPRWKYAGDLALIEQLGLQERVHFLYNVPHHDLPAIYNLASCFVFPSLYESFGLVQLEAMACGCPVVAARAGAIPEITDGAALLFDPYKPEDMANAILRVLSDAALRQACMAQGLVRAQAFTWGRCASETLQVLQEVVEE